jgi:peptidyl-prolyl cis-trans isomerase B (cyclophilin B)
MRKQCLALLILLYAIVTGCAQQKDHIVTIKTKYGDMVAILYDETPKHKANFIKLAKSHFYDSLLFHRVIEGFMIQGGDPESKKAKPGARLGNGGPGYTIEAEIIPGFIHERGALSAARLSDDMNPGRASSGSQFYIVQGKKYNETELTLDPKKFNEALGQFFQKPENRSYYDSLGTFYRKNDSKGMENYLISLRPTVEQQLNIKVTKEVSPEVVKVYTTNGGALHLDGQYTVFGKVIKGLDVIDKIAALKRDPAERPLEDVRMVVTVEEMSKKKIEKLYGYHYPEKKEK